jgi:hypothetical protein
MLNVVAFLVLFDKNRLIPAPGSPFTLPCFTFIAHSVHHNTTLTCYQSGEKLENGPHSAPVHNKEGPNVKSTNKVGINTHT